MQTKSSRAEKSSWESGEIGQPKAQGEDPSNSAVPGTDFFGPLLGERDSIWEQVDLFPLKSAYKIMY